MMGPLEQQRAVDHIEGALRDRNRAQVAGDDVVVGAARVVQHAHGKRLVSVDGGDGDLEAALGEFADAELARWRQAACLRRA